MGRPITAKDEDALNFKLIPLSMKIKIHSFDHMFERNKLFVPLERERAEFIVNVDRICSKIVLEREKKKIVGKFCFYLFLGCLKYSSKKNHFWCIDIAQQSVKPDKC
jgi:hypothetical protein